VTDRRAGLRRIALGCALFTLLGAAIPAAAATPPTTPTPQPPATASDGSPIPPKLDLPAAEAALAGTQHVYLAPGAVAAFDEQAVGDALAKHPKMRLLVEPFTGEYIKGDNYPSDDDYTDQVYTPLSDWARTHNYQLLDVTGLYVRDMDGDAFGPSDIDELRTLTGYYDVTNSLIGLIKYLDDPHATHYESPPPPKTIAPSAAQLATLTDALRANPIYNAPDRTGDLLQADTAALVKQYTGFTMRAAAFPPVPVGQPFVNYAPALAKEFPNDEIMVSYGEWMEVAGPNLAALTSARDYAYGRYDDATLEQGASMTNRIGSILVRTYDLVRKHPFARPQPTPYDLRHRISVLAPWVLLGAAVSLGGGALLLWQRRRAETQRAQHIALRRESALATAAIAALSGHLLHDKKASSAVAERQATATTLFEQARTPAAMRRVREIAEQGEEALRR
jgi:hypothetical protein